MLEKLFWVLYKKLTHALLTEFLKVGSDDALKPDLDGVK